MYAQPEVVGIAATVKDTFCQRIGRFAEIVAQVGNLGTCLGGKKPQVLANIPWNTPAQSISPR
jgi:hypothetical protein